MSKTLKGVDVSYANGTVNWATLKKAGVDFAIIRCGFGSENPQQVDKRFKANIQGCIDNRLNLLQLSDYPLWIAAPNAKLPGLACDLWQYSWTGKFDGMSCDFDMNFCYTDYDEKTAQSESQTRTQSGLVIRLRSRQALHHI